MRISHRDLLDLGLRLYRAAKEDDLTGGAAELAFRFFLALFPFFIFLAALGSFVADVSGVSNPTDEIMDALGKSLPEDAASVLRKQLEAVIGSRDPGLLSFGILGAIWAASGGVGTVMRKMNLAYGVRETRPLWKRLALSLALTALGGGVLVVAFLIFVAGQVYGLRIAEALGMGGLAASVFTLARWPAVIVLALMATAVLFWAAPCVDLRFRWITPGAVLFTAGWLAASYLFGLYIASFGSFNETYGTLAGVVVALLWFYITGFVLLLGAELNAVLAQRANERRETAISEPGPVEE